MQFLNITQTAKFCGVSYPTFWRMLQRGEGPPWMRIGKRRLFDRADILEFLNASKQKPSKLGSN